MTQERTTALPALNTPPPPSLSLKNVADTGNGITSHHYTLHFVQGVMIQ